MNFGVYPEFGLCTKVFNPPNPGYSIGHGGVWMVSGGFDSGLSLVAHDHVDQRGGATVYCGQGSFQSRLEFVGVFYPFTVAAEGRH